MKYIKLFEEIEYSYSKGVERRKKTAELKQRLASLLVEYLNCFDLEAESYPNGRVGCKFKNNTRGGINLTKSGYIMEIEWSYNDYFREELEILISWLKEQGLNISISSSKIKTYMNLKVDEIDDFMNAIRKLIDSDEIQLMMNVKRYNV